MRRALPLLLLLACSSSSPAAPEADTGVADAGDTSDPEDLGPPAPPDWDRTVTAPTEDDAKKGRTSCAYKKGALAAETHGAGTPTGKTLPIDTVVIAMQENRSFDHYFLKLKERGHADAEVAPPEFSNPDLDGTPIKPFRDKQLCFLDTSHSWGAAHVEWDDGKMDGFIRANEETGAPPKGGTADLLRGTRAMGYYEPDDLPFMYWAADQYAIGDHYHCSVLTSTWTNRMYLYAASSFGRISNKPPNMPPGALTIFDMLQMRRVTWKVYATNTPPEAMFVSQFLKHKAFHFTTIDQFYEDAKNGALPQVAFVDGSNGEGKTFDDAETDEHPPAVMQVGQAMLAKVTRALMASPQWPRAAFFIDYDEHGGLFDHVPPPEACAPDDIPPERSPTDAPGDYKRLGIRVPFVVISPWAKQGFIGHHTYDHTSVTRFVEARFDLPAMSARDANAEAPYDLFDFTTPRTDKPTVPDVKVDPEVLARCNKTFN